MSYWFERAKKKVGRKRDRRIKVTDEEKEIIIKLHRQGLSSREIARQYQDRCSRRLIQFIIYPERAKRQVELRRIRGEITTKAKRALYMRRYRQHLKDIYGLKRLLDSKSKMLINKNTS